MNNSSPSNSEKVFMEFLVNLKTWNTQKASQEQKESFWFTRFQNLSPILLPYVFLWAVHYHLPKTMERCLKKCRTSQRKEWVNMTHEQLFKNPKFEASEWLKFQTERLMDHPHYENKTLPPLMDCLFQGNLEMTSKLLECGADARFLENKEFYSTLMVVTSQSVVGINEPLQPKQSHQKEIQIIKELIKYGANPSYSNSKNENALSLAIKRQNLELCQFFLDESPELIEQKISTKPHNFLKAEPIPLNFAVLKFSQVASLYSTYKSFEHEQIKDHSLKIVKLLLEKSKGPSEYFLEKMSKDPELLNAVVEIQSKKLQNDLPQRVKKLEKTRL